MKKFIPKHRWKNFVFSKVAVGFLAVLAIFTANATWNMYQKYAESKEYKEQALARLQKLQGRESRLEIDIKNLETEMGIEQELRKRFDIAREGEEVLVIVDGVQEEEGESGRILKKSFWSKFKEFFK